ncbi:endosome-associated-trafficking regulator 1 isoform X2 [Pelodiscus sinensis]|uniref:endosome-associated-trafficking regulator 1 isoform X2 n=1 Tax=Pelodiscus sinensis TaxID=13735 RepID=UPI003F6B5E1C
MAGRALRSPSPPLPPWPGAEPDAANPFSFRAFVRSQARGGASPQDAAAAPFFPDPRAALPEEAEWSGSYQPAAVERALRSPAACSELEDAAPWPLDESEERSLAPGGDGRHPPLQLGRRELQEENARLRSKINQLLFLSETQAAKVRTLERKLEENRIKEQKEARDLEAMVQHVEQNLQLMTKRAVKAENNVVKLKQENALLQMKNYKTENEVLKTGQSASLSVVKQNAAVALQNLLSVITNSRSSIKQLVSGAESLQVVAELLKSIDRISEISDDGS